MIVTVVGILKRKVFVLPIMIWLCSRGTDRAAIYGLKHCRVIVDRAGVEL